MNSKYKLNMEIRFAPSPWSRDKTLKGHPMIVAPGGRTVCYLEPAGFSDLAEMEATANAIAGTPGLVQAVIAALPQIGGGPKKTGLLQALERMGIKPLASQPLERAEGQA